MKRSPMRRTALKSKYKPTGPAQDVVEAVYERASWACERCQSGVGPERGVDHHVHHRRPRANGGTIRPDTNLPSNLLLLCPGCHEHIEHNRTAAERDGLLVRQNHDPAQRRVLLAVGPVYLTVDARYSITPPREQP